MFLTSWTLPKLEGSSLTLIVNELSNTIDLPSTLLRAQALFRRFQRTVEAVDKKKNFPAPSVRQRKPIEPAPSNTDAKQKSSAPARKPAAAGTGSDVTGARPNSSTDGEPMKDKVISDELRGLLSRKVTVMDKKTSPR